MFSLVAFNGIIVIISTIIVSVLLSVVTAGNSAVSRALNAFEGSKY